METFSSEMSSGNKQRQIQQIDLIPKTIVIEDSSDDNRSNSVSFKNLPTTIQPYSIQSKSVIDRQLDNQSSSSAEISTYIPSSNFQSSSSYNQLSMSQLQEALLEKEQSQRDQYTNSIHLMQPTSQANTNQNQNTSQPSQMVQNASNNHSNGNLPGANNSQQPAQVQNTNQNQGGELQNQMLQQLLSQMTQGQPSQGQTADPNIQPQIQVQQPQVISQQTPIQTNSEQIKQTQVGHTAQQVADQMHQNQSQSNHEQTGATQPQCNTSDPQQLQSQNGQQIGASTQNVPSGQPPAQNQIGQHTQQQNMVQSQGQNSGQPQKTMESILSALTQFQQQQQNTVQNAQSTQNTKIAANHTPVINHQTNQSNQQQPQSSQTQQQQQQQPQNTNQMSQTHMVASGQPQQQVLPSGQPQSQQAQQVQMAQGNIQGQNQMTMVLSSIQQYLKNMQPNQGVAQNQFAQSQGQTGQLQQNQIQVISQVLGQALQNFQPSVSANQLNQTSHSPMSVPQQVAQHQQQQQLNQNQLQQQSQQPFAASSAAQSQQQQQFNTMQAQQFNQNQSSGQNAQQQQQFGGGGATNTTEGAQQEQWQSQQQQQQPNQPQQTSQPSHGQNTQLQQNNDQLHYQQQPQIQTANGTQSAMMQTGATNVHGQQTGQMQQNLQTISGTTPQTQKEFQGQEFQTQEYQSQDQFKSQIGLSGQGVSHFQQTSSQPYQQTGLTAQVAGLHGFQQSQHTLGQQQQPQQQQFGYGGFPGQLQGGTDQQATPVQHGLANQQIKPQGEPKFVKFFVGGVLYSAREADVEQYFSKFGKVVDVAIMRDKQTGRSRGFAFVTFEEYNEDSLRELKQKMLYPVEPHVIQNRKIEVREGDGNKPADSFLGKGTQSGPPTTPVHANGMGSTSASKHQTSGKDRANQRRDRGGMSPRGKEQTGDRGGHGHGRDRHSNRSGRNRSRSRDRSSVAGGSGRRNNFGQGGDQEQKFGKGVRDKVFVGGLDYSLTDEDFIEHFSMFGQVKEAQIVRDPVNQQSRGFGFVTYVDEQVARRLINEVSNTRINGRKVDLRNADPKIQDKIAMMNRRNKSGGAQGQSSSHSGSNQYGQGHKHSGQSGDNKDGRHNQNARQDKRGESHGNRRGMGGDMNRSHMSGNETRHRSQSRNRQMNQNRGGMQTSANRDDPQKDNPDRFDMQGNQFDRQKGQNDMMSKDWLDMQSVNDPFSQFARKHFGSSSLINKHDDDQSNFSGVGASATGHNFNKPDQGNLQKNPEYSGMMDGLNDPSNFTSVDIDKPFFDTDLKSGSKEQASQSQTKKTEVAPKSHYSKSQGQQNVIDSVNQADTLPGSSMTKIRADMPLASSLSKSSPTPTRQHSQPKTSGQ